MWNNNNNNQGGGWGGNRNPYSVGGGGQPAFYSDATSMADRSSLVTKVMWFTTFSIIAAMAGAWTGAFQLKLTGFGGGTWILLMIAEIALMLGAYALRERQGINFVMLYAFTFVTGLAISPIINILTTSGNGNIIIQALGATAGLTVALSAYAWTTKRDFSGFAPYLFVAVIGLMIVSLLNLLFHSAMLQSVIMYAGVLIFSFYLIFDVQRAKKFQNTVGNAIALTISIYLDILNLFLFILQILLSFRD
jgi:modulator of FtsH protease